MDLLNSFYTSASRYFNAFDFINCFKGVHWYKAGQEETPWLAGPLKQFKSKKKIALSIDLCFKGAVVYSYSLGYAVFQILLDMEVQFSY